MIRNLGQVAAIYIGSSAPRNTNLIWLDNTVVPFVFRAYDGSAWSELATHKWVRAYVDGWLVTLPPRQLADDGDYMLINSNNVNYKITVKDFVKSAVGNPLDFKGVIRVSADFPNPSTLEAGDMYVIITSPAGGTVTDPYSGKTFEDSEKIVWDEVTRSWESLGKINITVNLTTSYSETEVTIHSSAGKETTIQGATDQLAGVMLPGQYSWLQALSNGSIVPGDPSPLTPLTPAHKHNYNDIINRLVSQQGTGESTIDPMSQKATTDALNLKFDKASVLQVSGAATDKVMSQKAVTDALKTLSDDFNNKLTNYLPLVGGTMTGSIIFPNRRGIIGRLVDGTGNIQIAVVNANNNVEIGNSNTPLMLVSNSTDLTHYRDNNTYKIWDSYNLSKPTVYNGGAIGTPTTIYDRNLSVNGAGWTFLSATNAPTTSIFAPTTVGTKGYYLVSSGTGAPVWQQLEDLGDGKYLPLIGGTLTGQLTIKQSVDIKLRLQSTDADNHCIIQAINSQASQLGVFGYAGDKWAIGHGGTYYEIWDKFNLKDPVTLSGNNTFTGNNTFQAGKFNVGPFEVASSGSLLSNISTPAGSAWSRSLVFRANNDIPSSLVFGGYNSVDNTSIGYVYIGIGDVNYQTAQYKFRPTSLTVPIVWSLDDPSGNALVWSQSSTLAHLGRTSGTTKIRSGNVNLIHTKGTTDYTILDSSNYTEFLPQNIAWTYGFVSHAVNNDGYDANSMIGVDKPKLLFNYYTQGKIVNAPTGMGYGNVLQIDGPYTSSYNEAALKTQLAFDIIHNVDNGTGSMWYRTANNKGMAVANWRRVLTADENIAGLSFDGNNYPAIIRVDGTTYPWLRANGNGFLPNVEKSLASGGASQLGSSSWAFLAGYISSVYTNKLVFGVTGPYMIASTNAFQFLNSAGGAHKVATGSLYVGPSYTSDDLSLVPTNGIYSKGVIKSAAGFTSNFRQTNLNLAKTGNDVLYISSFTVDAAGSPGTDSNTGKNVNDGMFLTYFWVNDSAFQLAADIDGTGIAYRQYIPSSGNSTTGWKFLADTNWVVSKINSSTSNFLKKTGDTATGQIILDSNGIAFKANTWTNDLAPNRNYGGYLQVLDAYDASSAGGPTNYGTVLQVNSKNAHWANQLWFPGGAEASKNGLYYRHMAYNQTEYSDWQKILTNKDVNIIQTQSSSNPSTLPANQIFYSEIKGVVETPTTNGSLFSVQGDDEGIQLWASSSKTELYYRTKWTSFGNWIKLATTSNLGNYLPLSGGTISSSKSNPLIINSTHVSQSSIDFSREGVDKGTVGFYESLGSFLQNVTGETLAVKSDGAYYGANINSLRKLATVTDLNNYLPLTGGTLNGALTINGPNTLYHCTLNSSYTNETVLSVQRKGIYKAAFGYYDGIGAFLYNYPSAKYLFVDDNGDARVGTTNGSTKLALITDIPTVSGYLPLSGGTMTGALTMNSRRNNAVIDVVGGAGNSWDGGAGALSVQVPSDNGQTPLILARRSGATINTTTLSERLLDMALLDTGTIFRVGMSGVNALELEVTSFTNKVGIGKLFGKQIATTDQIPSIPSISISNSGSGNAVTAISASGHTLTVTKGATYLTSHQTIYDLTFQAGTFSAKTFDPNGAATTVNIPTKTSHITNDSGFITSSALNGYATQAWVNSQNFVKSTSTKKVTDIQPVDALPATQASGVLYLVFG